MIEGFSDREDKPCLLCGTSQCKQWPRCPRRYACEKCYTRKGWGSQLKAACKASGKSIEDIAKEICRHPSTLHKYIINVITPDALIRLQLAEILGCTECKYENRSDKK